MMVYREAIEVLDGAIPELLNKMVDEEHLQIALAWKMLRKKLLAVLSNEANGGDQHRYGEGSRMSLADLIINSGSADVGCAKLFCASCGAHLGEMCAEYKKFGDELARSGCGFRRALELLEAEREGRLVILPAKEVYELTWDPGPDCDLMCPVSFGGHGCCDMCTEGKVFAYKRTCKQEHIEQIGHNVFLSKEEAEAEAAKINAMYEEKERSVDQQKEKET